MEWRVDAIILALLSLVVLAFYIWTATSSSDSSDWEWRPGGVEGRAHPGPENYYNLVTSGFLSGHLYLPVQPAPALLALQNPYAEQGAGIRLQDASLYKGKYYLYYGPTPVLTLFLPWRLLTGRGMPQSFAVLVYAATGYIVSCLLLLLLLRAANVQVPRPLKGVLVLTLGCGNLALVLIRRPGAMYEVAIMAGYCFFMVGIYLLARAVIAAERKSWMLIGAGVCVGLTAGCRPHYGVVAMVVLALYAVHVIWSRRARGATLIRELLDFGGPVVLCGLAIAWYNYARFDNPFQFGQDYQLTGSNVAHIRVHARHILPTLYFYLFSQPLWLDQFPFVQLMRQAPTPFGHPGWMPWINLEEEFAGILTIVPLCLAGIVLPLVILRRKFAGSVKVIVLMLWAAAVTMLFCICYAGSIGMRYHVDYCPELLVSALLVCLWLASGARIRWQKCSVLTLMVAGCIWGSLCTAAVSINSYNHSLRTRNPQCFKKLVALSGGDPEAIRYPVRNLKFEATLVISTGPSSMTEAIVSSGSPHAGDVVFLEYTAADRARFGLKHGNAPPVVGPEVTLQPGVPHRFCFEYLRTDHESLTASLNGRIVLSREGEMYFTSPSEVVLGQDRTGAGLPPFSGQLAVKDGVALVFGE